MEDCFACQVLDRVVGRQEIGTTVDGPGFDGHLVDFDELMLRQKRFEKEEKIALKNWKSKHC